MTLRACRALLLGWVIAAWGVLPAGAGETDLQLAGQDPAFAAVAVGPRAVSLNPANLGLLPRRGVQFVALEVGLGNNAYSLSDYNRFNGAYWGAQEKEEILRKIESSHVRMEGVGGATLMGVSLGSVAVSTETRVLSRLEVPKELLRLMLYGNTVGEAFTLRDAAGGGMAFTELRLSAARPLDGVGRLLSLPLEHAQVGVSLKALHGWGFAELTESSGGLTTTDQTIAGHGRIETLQAAGGWGFGLDLGVSGFIAHRWIASLAVRDLVGRIRWNRQVEQRTDSFTVPEMDLGDIEADLVQTSSSVKAHAPVTRSLPATLNLSVGRLGSWLSTSATLEAPLRSGPTGKDAVGVSIGAGWRAYRWLVVRARAGLGGLQGTRLGGGVGVAAGPVACDLALRTWGTLNPFASKGFGLAFGVGMGGWIRPLREG